MNFHEIFTTVYPMLKEHRIPVALSIVGLIFLVYGLISSLGVNNASESLVFQDSSVDARQEASASAKKAQQILVDVEGAVVKPGVYALQTNARIRDGLIAASGLSSNANREWVAKNLNLAAKLVDGAKIYVPALGQETKGSSAVQQVQDSLGVININTASTAELDNLAGIGLVTAQKIIDNRPYNDINDLLNKKIVAKSVFEKIKDKITAY